MQHEIRKPIPLLNNQGRLWEPGYARALFWEYDRSKINANKLKIKEWDYYLIYDKNYAIALTIADNGYMGLLSASFMDFTKSSFVTKSKMLAFPKGEMQMPATSKQGDITIRHQDVVMRFENNGSKRRLLVQWPRFHKKQTLNVELDLYEEMVDSIVVATPFKKEHQFYYNQKIVGLKASGIFALGTLEYPFDSITAQAILDWGRGVWPYRNTWYWSAASGYQDGVQIGFNLGCGFGDLMHATENMFFYQGVGHKLTDLELKVPKNFLDTWILSTKDDRLKLEFTPQLNRRAHVNLFLLASNQDQVFGHFNGSVQLDDGRVITITELQGFAEVVSNRW
ncbi:MAG: DUF2804 domain-containing protein [Erysipelotrichaceae bacterium]